MKFATGNIALKRRDDLENALTNKLPGMIRPAVSAALSALTGLAPTRITPVARTKPLILASAINGAEYSPRQFPQIPVTPTDAVRDALATYQAGARYVHAHARESRSGEQFASLEWFKQVRGGVAENAPALSLSFASSRKGMVANQILSGIAAAQLITPQLSIDRLVELELLRAIGMDAQPDLMTIFTALETKIGGPAGDSDAAIGSYGESAMRGYTDPALIAAYYARVRDLYASRNIVPEYEVTTFGALWTLEMLVRRGWMPKQPHLIFLFGFSARLPISRWMFEMSMSFVRYLKAHYDLSPVVSIGAVMHPKVSATKPRQINEMVESGKHDYLELVQWALSDETVDVIRVGLEDTPMHFGAAASNADLVALVHTACREVGIAVATDPHYVHNVLGIRR